MLEGGRILDLTEFHYMLMRFVDQGRHALTIRQLAVLLSCFLYDEDHTVRRLAVRLGSAKPAVSRMLDHLVREGLIERRADPRDRRSVLFECTPAAREFLERVVSGNMQRDRPPHEARKAG